MLLVASCLLIFVVRLLIVVGCVHLLFVVRVFLFGCLPGVWWWLRVVCWLLCVVCCLAFEV